MKERDDLDPGLGRALRALAEEDALLSTPPDVEDRLRAEVRSIARARRRRVQLSFVGIAAASITAVALTFWRATPGGRSAPADSPGDPIAREVATAFFPLLYSNVPATTGQVVRLEVPRAALVAFGLESVDAIRRPNAPATVYADIVIGEDGLARSVRFVLPFERLENRR